MEQFEWVSNEKKFERAKEELRKQNVILKATGRQEVEITEDLVKALYVKYGGLLVGSPESQLGVPEGQIMPGVLTEDEKEAIEEAYKPVKKERNNLCSIKFVYI